MARIRSVDEWIERDAIRFALDDAASFGAAVDRIVALLGDSVCLLGLGEALHGSEEILIARNRLFKRLVAAHGYSAVVIEASSPQARAINDYVLGRRGADDPAVEEWLGTGFGLLDANRELIEWMRAHNADAATTVMVHFHGFDIPLGAGGLSSPRRVFDVVLGFLDAVDAEFAGRQRDRITPLLGDAAGWERPAALYDPKQSIGLSPAATQLRVVAEDLVIELRIRGPELAARADRLAYADALHNAELAVKLLDAHAALATPGAYSRMLGIRDLIMADNLAHLLSSESGRGKVLAFAASGHLKRGLTQWRLPPGDEVKEWWPAGAHMTASLGAGYALIGMAVGTSDENGIGAPEPGTLEASLLGAGGSLLIPTHRGQGPAPTLPVRSGSARNPTYGPLTAESFEDFDWLVFFESTSYPRGSPPLSDWDA